MSDDGERRDDVARVRIAAGEVDATGKPPGRLQQIIVEYGVIGIITLLSLSALTYVGFAVAFMVGFEVEGADETAGALGAAAIGWAVTKPVRIPLAIVLTPIVAAIWHRVGSRIKRVGAAIWRRLRGKQEPPREG